MWRLGFRVQAAPVKTRYPCEACLRKRHVSSSSYNMHVSSSSYDMHVCSSQDLELLDHGDGVLEDGVLVELGLGAARQQASKLVEVLPCAAVSSCLWLASKLVQGLPCAESSKFPTPVRSPPPRSVVRPGGAGAGRSGAQQRNKRFFIILKIEGARCRG